MNIVTFERTDKNTVIVTIDGIKYGLPSEMYVVPSRYFKSDVDDYNIEISNGSNFKLQIDWRKVTVPTVLNRNELIDTLIRNFFFRDISGSGSGTSETYTNSTPTTITVGGIESGETFLNKTMSEMFTKLLYAYQYPSFSSFNILSQTQYVECGSSINSNKTFIWSTINNVNIVSNMTITDINASTQIATNLINDGAETLNINKTYSTQTTQTWRISATNSKSQILSRDYSVYWRNKLYYGEFVTDTLTEVDIKNLRINELNYNIAKTYIFNSGGYKYISHEDSLGTLTSFKDQNTNFDIPMEHPYIVSVTNSYGLTKNYKVYRTSNILGGNINIIAS